MFVTHGLSYLPQCDVIVTMKDSAIREVGTYAELIGNNGAFAEFMRTYASVEDNNEAETTGNLYLYLVKHLLRS